jgi:hypothetical protein
MRITRAFLAVSAAFVASHALGQQILEPAQGLLTGTPDSKLATYTWVSGSGFRISYPQKDSYFVVRLPAGTSLVGKTHLDVRLKNNATRPALIEANVSSNNGAGWLTSLVVLGPRETVELTMPLKESESYGLRAFPTPTDTTAFQTRSLGTIYPNDVRGLYFYSKDTLAADVNVDYIAATTHNVPMTGWVDTFGQQNFINWTGKVKSVDEMRAMISKDPTGIYPYEADQFGAVAGGKNYGPSERFRLEKDGTNWYLVAPSGNRFFSVGVNEVGAMAWTPISARESMFTDLANLQTQFPAHFTTRDGALGFNPYGINLQRKYGDTWRTQAYDIFPKRLRTWGFNTVGVNSWDYLQSQQWMPSTFGISLWSPHPHLAVSSKTISDVFDPAFVTAARSDVGLRLTQVKVNQPYSIGVFVDNEMPWGQGTNPDLNKRYAIARAALNGVGSASQKNFIATLQKKYVTIAALNTAWQSSYASWTALGLGGFNVPQTASAEMQGDLRGFVKRFATMYFKTIDEAIAASGYKGLYLGCRFTRLDYTPEVLAAAKQYVDVLSFNIYQGFPSRSNPDLKAMDFPVLISEFCFGANDRGRVGMPLYPTLTENSRIDAYKRFFADIKTWKNLVGVHWYRWDDFPSTAKSDHDNMQEGLVSITDKFYDEFLAQTAATSADYMNSLKLAP